MPLPDGFPFAVRPATLSTVGMASGLQRRLLRMLLVPLFLLAGLNIWYDLRSAEGATVEQDRLLGSLVPLLVDSVVAGGDSRANPPIMLIAPPIEDFLAERKPYAAYALLGNEGLVILGADWLRGLPPTNREPEFFSAEYEGVSYRVVSQRVRTSAGELVVRLADGADQRQQWVRRAWLKVILPHVGLLIAASFAVNWAVRRALRPLLELRDAVERRTPSDLSALDASHSPDEVRPLVHSINRLLGLVRAHTESQRRFVADAAHQLRTPLAALQAQAEAWAQAAAQTPPPAGAGVMVPVEQVMRLRQATRRTSQLANQLLALSRADARMGHAQALERIDLKQLCEVLLEAHLDDAMDKGLDLGLEVMPAHANGVEWLLRELVSNLLDNAIRYTPAGGHVTLRCGMHAPTGATVAQPFLEVEDDGPGIAASQRSRVLDRFCRLPGTPGDGTGLGLAIADEIARLHDSALTLADGATGRGLRIGLTLPA